VEDLHSNTQSHWSSGSTVCFPSRGSAVCVPGMHPLSQWNRFLLLVLSCYTGDPDVITGLVLGSAPTMGSFTRLRARQCEKPPVTIHAYLQFHSTPCRSSSSSQHSDQLEPRSSCLGGSPVETLQFHSSTQSHWSSGSTIASCPGSQRFASRGCTCSHNGIGFHLLALSNYKLIF
jgi:hypothetical protein